MFVTHCLPSSSTTPFSLSLSHSHHPHKPKFLHNPTTISLPTRPSTHPSWLAQVQEPTTTTTTTTTISSTSQEEGPVELTQSIFATTDEPTPIQVATSVLLTGAISVFLFRSIRRRAQRVKELRFRSSEVKKSLKDEALDSLKAMGSAPIGAKSPPSPVQTLLGGLAAGAIALVLYKFTTTIEAALNRQAVSDNFSVRQITITIRTIVNGLCYLATFVFGINSIGLLLYTVQLTVNSFMEDFSDKETENKGETQSSSLNSTAEIPVDNSELSSSKEDQS